MDKHLQTFTERFAKELQEENVAIFAGAGLSVGAGYVNWKKLLEPIARDLDLDIDRENDLISLAQYHFNEKANRSELNRILIEQLSPGHKPTDNHKILARLPIKTYWTTNYDRLIETSLSDANKVADVKYTTDQLKHTKPKRDAIVYKMHGDIEHPDSAVLTKDDYEQYSTFHGPFVTALSGDLVAKMFLFLGFSFTDPNLDYILSRVRISLHSKPRDHYCVFKACQRNDYKDEEEFRYADLKQRLAVNDLKRFGVQMLLLPSYSDLTILLKNVENLYKRRTVFISGSIGDYGGWGQERSDKFVTELTRSLILNKNKIVSGFGVGVGSLVVSGALKELYEKQGRRLHDELILRPFPQGPQDVRHWEIYRHEMIAHAGVAVFIFGNKIENGKTVDATGVRREFEIAREQGLLLIPIGATGSVSKELWQKVMSEFAAFYPEHSDLKPLLLSLNNDSDDQKLIGTVIDIINKSKGK